MQALTGNSALRGEFEALSAYLASSPASHHVQCVPRLARGLQYYEGLVFEVVVPGVGVGSVGGGGAYLVQRMHGVGISFGLDRLMTAGGACVGANAPMIGVTAGGATMGVVHMLRDAGMAVLAPTTSQLSAQLRLFANDCALVVLVDVPEDGQLTHATCATGGSVH